MNLDYDARFKSDGLKHVEWANRKLCSVAEGIAEKYPTYFGYERKNPDRFPYSGHLYERSTTSMMMTWTSTGLNLWPAACYLPKGKMMNFNNYELDYYNSGIIKSSDDEIYYILPEQFADWRKLPEMSQTERILFIEDKLPTFIDKLIKDRMNIDKMFKEKEIREAAAQYD